MNVKKLLQTLLVLVLALTITIAPQTNAQNKEIKMADVPSQCIQYLWLFGTNETEETLEAPEVFDIPVIKVFYNINTNRVVILGDDDGRKEIPTFATDFAHPANQGLLMLDGSGNLAGYTEVGSLNPLIEAGTFAIPERWPVGYARVGDVHMTTALVQDVLAVDGVTTLDRAVQSSVQAPVAITSLVASETYNYSIRVDCNVGTKQTLFTLDTDENFVVTDIIINYDDGALTTAECTFGWNANADDVVANTRYSSITGADTYTKAVILDGAKRGTSTQTFGVKFGTTEAIHLRIDVIGILRYVP